MTAVPNNPKIYHITHTSNLVPMLQAGVILSDKEQLGRGSACTNVGMSKIKKRRLEEIVVPCHAGTKVGEYTPFYFCPRSIMLYMLHMGNHQELSYKGGQVPIVHLQADLTATIKWAEDNRIPWAFSDRNAGSFVASFFNRVQDLDKINWDAVSKNDFREMLIKEGKQAEFLVYNSFPFHLIEKIGVINSETQIAVESMLDNSVARPIVNVEPGWYF